jgi:hypothetical protein
MVWGELIRGSAEERVRGDTSGKPPYPNVPNLELAFDDACRTLAMHLPRRPK